MDSQVNNVIFAKTKPQGGRIEKLLVSCKRVVTGNFLAMLFNQVEPDKPSDSWSSDSQRKENKWDLNIY